MIDVKQIAEKKDEYIASIRDRNLDLNIDTIDHLYTQTMDLKRSLEDIRHQRNENTSKLQKGSEEMRQSLVEQGKKLKQELAEKEHQYKELQETLTTLAEKVPNLIHPQSPRGKEEKDNLVSRKYGTPPSFSFQAKDHLKLGKDLDIIDFEKAAEVSGPKFYYLKNKAVLLEFALIRFGMDTLLKHGFSVMQTPDIAKLSVISLLGFQSRGPESNVYKLEDEDIGLIGTSEIPLGAYYLDSILKEEELPIKMAGISHCFRKEAGAAGQYSKGLYRVHQFTKLEMFVFCHPEKSEEIHKTLLGIEEEIYQNLEIPYRIVEACSGDLGSPAYRKFDVEAWMPGRGDNGSYGEITSVSNCTDYQAQRLNIRVNSSTQKKKIWPHMLNGTAIATSRVLVAILENYQKEDGSVQIPKALEPYCGFSCIEP